MTVSTNRHTADDSLSASHIRYYQFAGFTIRVMSDLPILAQTFQEKFRKFRLDAPSDDMVTLHHHFSFPTGVEIPQGREIYHTHPWAVDLLPDAMHYRGIMPETNELFCYASFDIEHRHGDIYHPNDALYRHGDWHALSLFATDQIWLAHALIPRQACYLHSAGMVMDGHGMLFLGHSGAGKSTTLTMLRNHGELLCDDRNVVRRWPEGFRVHGTWSHGDLPDVSPNSAPLRGLFFLEQAPVNAIVPLSRTETMRRLLLLVIKPAVTASWMERVVTLLEQLCDEVPAYRLQLDKSGAVAGMLHDFLAHNQ